MSQPAVQIGQVVNALLERGWRWFWRYPIVASILAAVAVTLAMTLVIRWYDSIRAPRVCTFYTAPTGGGGHKLGRAVQDSPQQGRPLFGPLPVTIRAVSSAGYEENRQRVESDPFGLIMALGHDGFKGNESTNVRVLLPLEYKMLHIVVSKQLYDAARRLQPKSADTAETEQRLMSSILRCLAKSGDSKEYSPLAVLLGLSTPGNWRGSTSDDVFEKYVKHRVFLGQSQSGTRQVAEVVLQHYGLNVAELDCDIDYDWNGVFDALVNEKIHMAFVLAEPGQGILPKLARREGFYLLGLDDAAGISATYPHIKSQGMAGHLYGARPNGEWFCNSVINMLATREVIIVSSRMSQKDAYYLATQLRSRLSALGTQVRWRIPPNEVQRQESTELMYPVHPGAVFVQTDSAPWYEWIPAPIRAAGWTILLTIVLHGLATRLKLFEESASPEAPSPETATVVTAPSPSSLMLAHLIQEIDGRIDEFEREVHSMTAVEYQKWLEVYRALNRKAVRLAADHSFDARQLEDVRSRLSALSWVIESGHDADVEVAAAVSRIASATAPTTLTGNGDSAHSGNGDSANDLPSDSPTRPR